MNNGLNFYCFKFNSQIRRFIERVTSNDLNEKYEKVKNWFKKDYIEEKNQLREIIEGPYLDALDMQSPYYKGKLEDAKNLWIIFL